MLWSCGANQNAWLTAEKLSPGYTGAPWRFRHHLVRSALSSTIGSPSSLSAQIPCQAEALAMTGRFDRLSCLGRSHLCSGGGHRCDHQEGCGRASGAIGFEVRFHLHGGLLVSGVLGSAHLDGDSKFIPCAAYYLRRDYLLWFLSSLGTHEDCKRNTRGSSEDILSSDPVSSTMTTVTSPEVELLAGNRDIASPGLPGVIPLDHCPWEQDGVVV